jgi:hypothetical protein
MSYTFMDGSCRRILQALHRRAGLPGSEWFDRSVNFFPDSVAWLIELDFIRRSDDGELVLTERGLAERVFFKEDYAVSAQIECDEIAISPGEIWTCSVLSLLAPFFDPAGFLFSPCLEPLPDLKICSIAKFALGTNDEHVFADPKPSVDDVSRMMTAGEMTLGRILPGYKILIQMRNDGRQRVRVKVQVYGSTVPFQDTR